MARRKEAAAAQAADTNEVQENTTEAQAARLPDERQPGDEPPEPKKQWAKRQDPFPSHSHYWDDGYKIGYQESERNREAQIKFGTGSKDDQPKNWYDFGKRVLILLLTSPCSRVRLILVV